MSSEPKIDLSPREQEIMECLVRGFTDREIADHIGMGEPTVKLDLARIMDKLGVSSRLALLLVANAESANAQLTEVTPTGVLKPPLAPLKRRPWTPEV